jgi:hypothetical protein
MQAYLEQLVKVNVLKFNQENNTYETSNGFKITLADHGCEWNIEGFYINKTSNKVMAVTDEWDYDECNDLEKEFSNPDYLTIEKVVEVTLEQLLDEATNGQ